MIPWYLIVGGCLTIILVLGRFIWQLVGCLTFECNAVFGHFRRVDNVPKTKKVLEKKDAN